MASFRFGVNHSPHTMHERPRFGGRKRFGIGSIGYLTAHATIGTSTKTPRIVLK